MGVGARISQHRFAEADIRYFSVSIDDLLSGESLLAIAEEETKSCIEKLQRSIFAAADMLAFLLIVLPLYPKSVNGFVYAVSLLHYAESAAGNRVIYWVLYLTLIALGILTYTAEASEKSVGLMMICSMTTGIIALLALALAGESYATAVAFPLLVVKGSTLLQKQRDA